MPIANLLITAANANGLDIFSKLAEDVLGKFEHITDKTKKSIGSDMNLMENLSLIMKDQEEEFNLLTKDIFADLLKHAPAGDDEEESETEGKLAQLLNKILKEREEATEEDDASPEDESPDGDDEEEETPDEEEETPDGGDEEEETPDGGDEEEETPDSEDPETEEESKIAQLLNIFTKEETETETESKLAQIIDKFVKENSAASEAEVMISSIVEKLMKPATESMKLESSDMSKLIEDALKLQDVKLKFLEPLAKIPSKVAHDAKDTADNMGLGKLLNLKGSVSQKAHGVPLKLKEEVEKVFGDIVGTVSAIDSKVRGKVEQKFGKIDEKVQKVVGDVEEKLAKLPIPSGGNKPMGDLTPEMIMEFLNEFKHPSGEKPEFDLKDFASEIESFFKGLIGKFEKSVDDMDPKELVDISSLLEVKGDSLDVITAALSSSDVQDAVNTKIFAVTQAVADSKFANYFEKILNIFPKNIISVKHTGMDGSKIRDDIIKGFEKIEDVAQHSIEKVTKKVQDACKIGGIGDCDDLIEPLVKSIEDLTDAVEDKITDAIFVEAVAAWLFKQVLGEEA